VYTTLHHLAYGFQVCGSSPSLGCRLYQVRQVAIVPAVLIRVCTQHVSLLNPSLTKKNGDRELPSEDTEDEVQTGRAIVFHRR
jgi:hypothetical protein